MSDRNKGARGHRSQNNHPSTPIHSACRTPVDVAVAAVHGELLKPSEGMVRAIMLCWKERICSKLRSSVVGRRSLPHQGVKVTTGRITSSSHRHHIGIHNHACIIRYHQVSASFQLILTAPLPCSCEVCGHEVVPWLGSGDALRG